MGCTQSKIDQDEAISRCKERKHYLACAVSKRNAFAAAHSSYAVSLKNTGAALSDYAHAEIPLSSSLASNPASSSGVNLNSVVPTMHPPMETLPPPPPPLPADIPPLQRSVSMPDIPLPQPLKKPPPQASIREEDEEADDEEEEEEEEEEDEDEEEEEEEEETLSKSRNHHHHQPLRRSEPIPTVTITASPPRPPPSIPVQPKPSKPIEPSIPTSDPSPPMDNPREAGWEFFFFGAPDASNPPILSQPEEPSWQESPKPVIIEEEKIERSPPPPPKVMPKVVEMPVEPPPKPPKQVKKAKPSTASSSGSNSGGGGSVHHQHTVSAGAAPMSVDSSKKGRMVTVPGPIISPLNLLRAIDLLDDQFLKAYESAGDVSKMLEATRMHYHSNFAGSRGHINHSDKIMRVITWNRSFKGLPQQDDMDGKIENDEPETHAVILDKLLAWEKKLYEEVKAGEVMKIEYQRKVARLNKQKKRGIRPEVLEKTKAAVSHLHTRYIVDMQSMDSTVSEISHLRDDLLYPKLVELVNGMARMWRSMHDHHRIQFKIIIDNRAPYEIPLPPKETTDEHYKQTFQLHKTAKELHLQLQNLIENQKEYVKNLNEWVRLSIIPIESSLKEKVSSPPRAPETPIKYLLHAWNDHISKLPLELAKTAILSFSEVVNTILVLQGDELTAKGRCEHTFRELERRRRQFDDWYRKYMEKRASLAEATGTEVGENQAQDPIVERKIQVEQLEIRLKEEEDNHRRLCKQVREKSVASLRTHLPELFRSLSEFSIAASEMYRYLSSNAQQN